jgi:hypothetical protein
VPVPSTLTKRGRPIEGQSAFLWSVAVVARTPSQMCASGRMRTLRESYTGSMVRSIPGLCIATAELPAHLPAGRHS